jgi:hypothetical protein
VVLLDANTKTEERRELIQIYNNLLPVLKKQLLTTAKVIETTQDIVIAEGKKTRRKIKNV